MTDPAPEGDRPWRRRVLRAGLVLALVWAGAAVVLVLLGVRAADAGRSELRSLADSLDLAQVIDADADLLDEASSSFDRADAMLNNPVVAPFRWLPVVGRQLRSGGQLASTGADLLRSGDRELETIRRELDDGLDGSADRLRLVSTTRGSVDRLLDDLRHADLGSGEALIGPLEDARRDALDRLDELETALDDAQRILTAAEGLLTGPSSYLVVAANNAEMRAGSGTFLSMGRIAFRDGAMDVGEFTPAVDLQLEESVTIPAEIERLWGWANPGREWRSLGFTPRFPVNAQTAIDLWEARGQPPVDGVVLLDVRGLQELLEATGPVETSVGTVGADGVVPFLLREQYVGVDESDEANAERREQLSEVAAAIVDRIGAGEVAAGDLYEALRSAQRGRHLMLWSTEPVQQAAWRAAGVDGELDDRSVLLGVANAGGTKTDPYLTVDAAVDTRRDGDEVELDLRVSMTNDTPTGLPRYMLGPAGTGDYAGVLVVYVPAACDIVEVRGGRVVARGPDGPSSAVGVGVDVAQGETATVEIRLRMPAELADALRLTASARVPATEWFVDDERRTDSRTQPLPIGA